MVSYFSIFFSSPSFWTVALLSLALIWVGWHVCATASLIPLPGLYFQEWEKDVYFHRGGTEGGVCAVCRTRYLACCYVTRSLLLSAHPYVKVHAREGREKSSEQHIVSWLIKELGCEVGSEFRFKWNTNKTRTWIFTIRNSKWNVFMQSKLSFFFFFFFQSPVYRRAGGREQS